MIGWMIPVPPEFRDWQVELTGAISTGIARGLEDGGEVEALKAIQENIQGMAGSSGGSPSRGMEISVESGMIHGRPVHWDSPSARKPVSRELGDLVWVASLAHNRRLILQRLCLIQTKVPKKHPKSPTVEVDQLQLELLSRMPPFTPGRKAGGARISLPNRSGMLGAYGFMIEDGEMPLLGASHLRVLLGGKKSTIFDKIGAVIASLDQQGAPFSGGVPCPFLPFLGWKPHRCMEIWEEYRCLWERWATGSIPPGIEAELGKAMACLPLMDCPSALSAVNVSRGVEAWTELRLGELWAPERARVSGGDRALGSFARHLAQLADLQRLSELLQEADIARSNENEWQEWPPADRVVLVVSVVIGMGEERR